MRHRAELSLPEGTSHPRQRYAKAAVWSAKLERFKGFEEKPALIDGLSGRTLTYGQLAGAIRLVAASLVQRGFGKGDVFAIYSPNLPKSATPSASSTPSGR